MRQLAIQAANSSLNAQDRLSLAPDVRSSFDQMVADGNSQGPDGEFVLAGAQGASRPFDSLGAYSGDSVRREIDGAESLRLISSIDGDLLTGAAGGVDVFAVVDRFATALETNDLVAIDTAIAELEQAGQQISAARTTGGGLDRSLLDADAARQSFELGLFSVISRAQDVDAIAAATELAEAAGALQTAQAVAVRLSELLNV
jgi:flagellin-like hook-associated protein FlgL